MSYQDLHAARTEAANNALANYDTGYAITDSSGWEACREDELTMRATADEARLSIHVRFHPGTAEVLDVYALDLETGEQVGGPASTPQERAEALGFASVEQMEDHQRWLDQQAEHNRRVRAAIAASGSSQVIDLRNVLWPS